MRTLSLGAPSGLWTSLGPARRAARVGRYSPLPAGVTWFGSDNDHVIRNADFLVVCVSSTVENTINATSLGMMKASAVVIPTEGNQVDWDALYNALLGR